MTAWSLLWYFFSHMVKLLIPFGKMSPVPVNSWVFLHELHFWDLFKVTQWYWGQGTGTAIQEPSLFSAVASDMLTCVLDISHVEKSKNILCAASKLMRPKFPPVFSENLLHLSSHHFWTISLYIPNHQWSTSVFHSRMVLFSPWALLTPLHI